MALLGFAVAAGFLRLTSREKVPDHSWMYKTRSRLPHEVHDKIFAWVLALVADHDLVKGERIGVDGAPCPWSASSRGNDQGHREPRPARAQPAQLRR